jgi:hypothetical protein
VVLGQETSDHDPGMKKRIFAALLWFYAGWYAGAVLAYVLGVSPMLGPIIGTAAAALFAGDPRRIIWTTRTPAPAPPTSQPGTYLIG